MVQDSLPIIDGLSVRACSASVWHARSPGNRSNARRGAAVIAVVEAGDGVELLVEEVVADVAETPVGGGVAGELEPAWHCIHSWKE